jgi:hypothetical protein
MNIKSKKYNIRSRSDLLTLLTQACELEHGLACSYLYTAFSLKQSLEEGGMTWQQLHMVKKWAAQIYLIASQEMFHLSQAWNILNAIGGSPYYLRPNFPQRSNYYPIGLPLSLDPFSEKVLKRYMMYELPQSMSEKDFLKNELGFQSEDLLEYTTVGELYGMIREGISALPERQLFVGDPALQMGTEEIDFQEIVKVINCETALRGIDRIIEQGEGNENMHENSHYGIFVSTLNEFVKERKKDRNFDPVRNALSNPVVHVKGDYRTDRGNYITNDFAAEVADIFDDVYNLMLRTLHFVFCAPGQSQDIRRKLCRFAIAVMPMILKPLGDVLMQLPAGRLHPSKNAGPPFSMSRHVILPMSERIAVPVIKDRFVELEKRMVVASQPNKLPALEAVTINIQRLTHYL